MIGVKDDYFGKGKRKGKAKKCDAGIFGAYPLHGGNHEKQQIALSSDITMDNVHELETKCVLAEEGVFGYMGYVRVTQIVSLDTVRLIYTDIH